MKNNKKSFERNKERENSQIEHEKQLLIQQKTNIDLEKEKLRKDIETLQFQKQQQSFTEFGNVAIYKFLFGIKWFLS